MVCAPRRPSASCLDSLDLMPRKADGRGPEGGRTKASQRYLNRRSGDPLIRWPVNDR